MKSIFLSENSRRFSRVYNEERVARIARDFDGDGVLYTQAALLADPEKFRDVEMIFSTYGMSTLSEAEIKSCLPKLKAIFYAAGSVQAFARPFLRCGVRVFSAWAANAYPVAEYTLAQILLANKGFFPTAQLMSRGEASEAQKYVGKYPGNLDVTVGIIGAGMIGRKVIELLRPFSIKTVVFDPFLSEERAAELGTEKVSLETLFEVSDVISNHLANNAQTKGMLNGSLFRKMKQGATFINTGRGAQVVEADLTNVLRERKDIYALLDVTDPEPPEEGHPFYRLENCILTPHIAGSKGNEYRRMADYMIAECESYIHGRPPLYEVTEEMLETMA